MSGEWLTKAFAEHSIAWFAISTVLGGVVGAATTLLFEDVIKPRIAFRREMRRVYARYREPLLGAANSLERQINTIVRNRGNAWLHDEYYRLSTFYKFGTFLFWVGEIESKFGFLEMSSSKKARAFVRRLFGPFAGLSSIRRYQLSAATALPRDIARAIGEDMAVESGSRGGPIGFASFVRKYAQDEQFIRWYRQLDLLLDAVARAPSADHLERLVVTGAQLELLVRFLDPGGTYVGGGVSNLDVIERQSLREALERDVADAK